MTGFGYFIWVGKGEIILRINLLWRVNGFYNILTLSASIMLALWGEITFIVP